MTRARLSSKAIIAAALWTPLIAASLARFPSAAASSHSITPALPVAFTTAGMTDISGPGVQDLAVAGQAVQFSGTGEAGRLYLRTMRGNLARTSFQAEVTLTLSSGSAGAGCAFLGLGAGKPDSDFYNEPAGAPALYARFAPTDFGGGVLTVSAGQREIARSPGAAGDGTHRVRLIWDAAGQRACFEVGRPAGEGKFRPDVSVTVSAAGLGFDDRNARLFVGGASGVAAEDVSITPLTLGQVKAAWPLAPLAGSVTAGSWLPAAAEARAAPENPVDTFLKALAGHMRLLQCNYHGSQLAQATPFEWAGAHGALRGRLSAGVGQWVCSGDAEPVKGQSDALDLTLSFRLTAGIAPSSGVAAAFDFSRWSARNYVLAPAAVYNGNRFRVYPVGYPPYIHNPKDRPPGMPVTITNVQHLNLGPEPARIEMNTGNLSTPLLGFYDPASKRGWILITTQKTRFGNSGMFIEENGAHNRASFVVSAPGVRGIRSNGPGQCESGDQAADWEPGDQVMLRLRLYSFRATGIPAFMARVFDVRKALSGQNVFRCIAPYSAVLGWETELQDSPRRWHQSPQFSYYKNGNGDSPYGNIQIGWVGGLMSTYPMMVDSTPERLARVSSTFDAVQEFMRGKTGLLHGIGKEGQVFGDDFDGDASVAMVRKNGDALYYALQQFEYLRLTGHASMVKPAWESMMKGVAKGLVHLWRTSGEFGQMVNVDTGKLEVSNSTAGATAIAGLALASRYFHEPDYLRVAEAAGRLYYRRDLCKGYTTGGPGEILECPDSESAFGLLEAYVALYEITGRAEWLRDARDCASYCSTWVVSYDYHFPPTSDLGRVQARSTGAVWASVQNEHGAPGICSSSGDCLLKLYRATGDRRYAALLQDIAHNIIEFVTTPNHPVGIGSGPGFVMERVNLSDWEGKGAVGRVLGGDTTSWCEVAVMLTAMEVPGIYLRTDTGTLIVFDHVQAQVVRRDRAGVTLQITNPTPFAARVSCLAETGDQARKPLGWNAFVKWPRIQLKPGESKLVSVRRDGSVSSASQAHRP